MASFNVPITELRLLGSTDRFNGNDSFTSIVELCQEDDDSVTNFESVNVLLAQLLYVRMKKDNESVFNRRLGTESSGSANNSYERILTCRCMISRSSSVNVFVILMGRSRNNKFFHRQLDQR